MRLILRIDDDQHVELTSDGEATRMAPPLPEAAGKGDRSIHDMLELLDALPATTAAEAFSALRQAFPNSGLGTRVEAIKKHRPKPC